ncbi:MAG: aspartate--tRNA ligase [Patescibacteria group bacterium]|jgi:aspartyl-tRNA synthetase
MSKRTLSVETPKLVGTEVTIKGWINARRNMGKIVFLDLRDRGGILQCVGVPSQMDPVSVETLKEVRPEWVLSITGVVQERGEKQKNTEMPTGTVEILIKTLTVLNTAQTPPFEIDKDTKGINEELRLKYRYLDLRSERMKKNIVLRNAVTQFMRQHLLADNFLEIETPILTKGTPEGAREFLVPSRTYPGQFYVLPQSPQQFKQLMMVAGMERYFQVARCFRDEDQRGDRQPEFTQLDLEMSFVEREDVMAVIEEMLIKLVQTVTPHKKIQEMPFPRLTYQEAMEKYKSDKPDLRKDKNDPDLLAFCWVVDFPFFEKTDEGGWTFSHNPFSSPKPEHMELLMKKENIGDILTTQYDIALNGFEAGGGSIRNHQSGALKKVFEVMGFKDEQIQDQFGHMLEAFDFGAPPHGGIALGIDRVIAILANEPNIREVIAVPKTGDARDLMMGAPSAVPKKALDDANIEVKKK